MTAGIDAIGTVVGRYDGTVPGAPALLLGSHVDTVRDAGRYDGALGVLAAVAAVAALRDAGERPAFPIEVLAFGDEEGLRFPTTLAGSRALAGGLAPTALEARDAEGVRLRDALAAFGCDPAAVPGLARRPEDVRAYVEPHIEQGPVLEAEGLPVGVVTAINGATRLAVHVTGRAGHAGTVPMRLRRDALAGAAEMILAVERRCSTASDLVGTVGRIDARPGAVNVIPGAVRFTAEVRSPEDAARGAAVADLASAFEGVAARRGLRLALEPAYDEPARSCDSELIRRLAAAVEGEGVRPRLLPSGAGHDGQAMAALCPIGMLFVRCRGGISHNPAEAITASDAETAVRVLLRFIRDLT